MKHVFIFAMLAAAHLARAQSLVSAPARLTPQERQQLQTRQNDRIGLATQYLAAERTKLQLQDKATFAQRKAVLDPMGQLHVRYQQRFEGVRVMGGEVIVHMNKSDQLRSITGTPVRDIALKTTPTLTEKSAVDLARADYLRTGSEMDSRAELVIYVRREIDGRGEQTVRGSNLAWKLRVEAPGQTPMRYYVDAHSGAILRKASAHVEVDYQPTTGTGRSGFRPQATSFSQSLAVPPPTPFTGPYRMLDPTRGNNRVYNMELKQPGNGWTGNGYWNVSKDWGSPNHFQYETMSTYGPEGVGSAFDAALALETEWDLLENVFDFHGFDGAGRGLTARVHYRKKTGEPYGDANWDDEYLNLGDATTNSRTDLGTVGHEGGHAIFQFALDEDDFEGEARGLNEGHGDIAGTLTSIYRKQSANGSELPVGVPLSWFMDRMESPLQYSAGGQQGLAYYVANMGQREEHTQGCAYGHAFVFLSYGASPTPGHNLYSTMLPQGMVGIGLHKAAEIWHLALHAYMTSTATFASTRQAYVQAAQDLYGIGSPEVYATMNAFFGIAVGDPAPADASNPDLSMSLSSVNETEQSAFVSMTSDDDRGVASLELLLDGSQVKILTGAGPKSWSGYISLEGLSLGNHTVRAIAKDAAGKTKEVVHQFTLNGKNRLIQNGTFEAGSTGWVKSGSGIITTGAAAFLDDGLAQFSSSNQWIYQTVTIPLEATYATLSYRLRSEPLPQVQWVESLLVQVLNNSGTTVLETLANHTQLTGLGSANAKGYISHSSSLLAFKGQTVRIRFAAANVAVAGRFKLDNVSLVYQAPLQANLTVNADPAEGLVTFFVDGIANIAPNQIKSVALVINGQELPEAMLQAPYLMALSTNLFVTNANYTVKARIRNLSNSVVGETGQEQFIIHPVTNLLMNPGFETPNAWWDLGGSAFGVDLPQGATMAYTGVRYAVLDASQAIETATQNVYLPGDADVITLGFRVRVNRALPYPDFNDKLVAVVLDLNNNVLGTVATVFGTTDTLQPANHRGYMSVKANLTPYKGQTVRLQFRSINVGPSPTSFLIDATSIVAKNYGVTE